MADRPFYTRLDLSPERSAVRWGRAHAAEVLGEWEVAEEVIDPALLIVSELLTNAVKHARPTSSPATVCSLFLWLTADQLTVAVHDDDRRPPILRSVSLDEEGGRGLVLVEANSLAWGYAYPSPRGKLVWARLSASTARTPRSLATDTTPSALAGNTA